MERIRYLETVVPGVMVSRQVYHVGILQYQVELNVNDLSYRVLSLTTKDNPVIISGKGKSLHDLKLKAKRALIGLGTQFKEENRNRKAE